MSKLILIFGLTIPVNISMIFCMLKLSLTSVYSILFKESQQNEYGC